MMLVALFFRAVSPSPSLPLPRGERAALAHPALRGIRTSLCSRASRAHYARFHELGNRSHE